MNYWQGEKVRLRGVEPDDAETFFHWNQNSEMGRNLDFLWPPISQALVHRQIGELALKSLEKDAFTWVIENMTGVAVGSITTHDCSSRSGTFSYGINIAPEHQRRGYAAEAIQLVLRYYFEELRYHKVNVQVHSHNRASIALHEYLGFVLEGTLREMVYAAGERYDILCFGMTKAEWQQRR